MQQVKGIAFEFHHEVLIFDTQGIELTVRGTADVVLYQGTGEPDDEDECNIHIEHCEYAVNVVDGIDPFWIEISDLEAELTRGKNRELSIIWDNVCEQIRDVAIDRIGGEYEQD